MRNLEVKRAGLILRFLMITLLILGLNMLVFCSHSSDTVKPSTRSRILFLIFSSDYSLLCFPLGAKIEIENAKSRKNQERSICTTSGHSAAGDKHRPRGTGTTTTTSSSGATRTPTSTITWPVSCTLKLLRIVFLKNEITPT